MLFGRKRYGRLYIQLVSTVSLTDRYDTAVCVKCENINNNFEIVIINNCSIFWHVVHVISFILYIYIYIYIYLVRDWRLGSAHVSATVILQIICALWTPRGSLSLRVYMQSTPRSTSQLVLALLDSCEMFRVTAAIVSMFPRPTTDHCRNSRSHAGHRIRTLTLRWSYSAVNCQRCLLPMNRNQDHSCPFT